MINTIDCDKLDRQFAKLEQLAAETEKVMSEMLSDLGADEEQHQKQDIVRGRTTPMKSGNNLHISDAVMDVLKRSKITGNNLALPPGQLDRKLYMDVKKALELAGGKWKTGPQEFVFEEDPRPKLGLMIEAGVVEDTKKKFQAFYTPPDLAETIAFRAGVSGYIVLEPSAGAGALVMACLKLGAKAVHAIEIDPKACEAMCKNVVEHEHVDDVVTIFNWDFLKYGPDRKYQRIVMNPPFSKGQDLKHVAQALNYLSQGGRLVAVLPGSKNMDRPKFRKLLGDYEWEIQDNDPGYFKSSGTAVNTCLLIVTKP